MTISKNEIILQEGTVFQVLNGLTATYDTGLIGRASRQSNRMLSMETARKAQFISTSTVCGGCILIDINRDSEDYIVISDMKEIIKGETVSVICQVLTCNATFDISYLSETADENGNRSKINTLKAGNVKGHIEALNADIKQYRAGINEYADYLIYIPFVELDLLDKVKVTAKGLNNTFKIVAIDSFTYSGISMVQICSDLRK